MDWAVGTTFRPFLLPLSTNLSRIGIPESRMASVRWRYGGPPQVTMDLPGRAVGYIDPSQVRLRYLVPLPLDSPEMTLSLWT